MVNGWIARFSSACPTSQTSKTISGTWRAGLGQNDAHGYTPDAAFGGTFQIDRATWDTLRSYSLSGAPSEDCYRISVKREPHDTPGAYIDTRVQAGDILDVSAPRGSFMFRQGERPVVLVGAGIGATPDLAMLPPQSAIAAFTPENLRQSK